MAVRGPAGSSFEVWVDTTFYSSVKQGGRNDWDPAQPLRMRPGETLYFYFNTATGDAPVVSIFCRSVSPI